MNRLNRRALSRRELGGRLVSIGFDDQTCQRVLDQLTELRVLDDALLGRSLIEETRRRTPAGTRLLRQKLMRRGLSTSLVEQLLAESDAETDPVAEARQLIAARLPAMSRLDAAKRNRRLWSLLTRRGFDADTIETAMATTDEHHA